MGVSTESTINSFSRSKLNWGLSKTAFFSFDFHVWGRDLSRVTVSRCSDLKSQVWTKNGTLRKPRWLEPMK